MASKPAPEAAALKAKKLAEQASEAAFLSFHTKALELIDSALSLAPRSADFTVERAEILCELGRPRAEVVSYLRGMTKDCDCVEKVAKEIRKIEEEITQDENWAKSTHCNLHSVGGEETKKLDRLMDWGKKSGVDVSKIKLVEYAEDFRGVHAAKRIKKGDVIMSVPEKAVVTFESIVANSPLAKLVFDSGVKLEREMTTAMACIVHDARKDPKNYWHEYAESFPNDVSTYPYFYSEKEMEYLKGCSMERKNLNARSRVERMRENVGKCKEEYKSVCDKVREFAEISFKEYLTLTTLATSRQFWVPTARGRCVTVPIVGKHCLAW